MPLATLGTTVYTTAILLRKEDGSVHMMAPGAVHTQVDGAKRLAEEFTGPIPWKFDSRDGVKTWRGVNGPATAYVTEATVR